MTDLVLRFVRSSGLMADLVVAQAKTTMPLIPSHVEAVTPDGHWLGAHLDGGTLKRPADYDKATRVDQLILRLDATETQATVFYDFLEHHVGEPYDWHAIIGLIPGFNLHEHVVNHSICSALMGLGLRKCAWFPSPLSVPLHLVSPANLLFAISARQYVPMTRSGDGWV